LPITNRSKLFAIEITYKEWAEFSQIDSSAQNSVDVHKHNSFFSENGFLQNQEFYPFSSV